MAKRTNWVAWRLAVLLTVLLLGGAGIGIRRTYAFAGYCRASSWWHFGYCQQLPGSRSPTGAVYLGPVVVQWVRR